MNLRNGKFVVESMEVKSTLKGKTSMTTTLVAYCGHSGESSVASER
jgi:predicted lipase